MKKNLTATVKPRKAVKPVGARKLPAPKKADLVAYVVSLGYTTKTAKQLLRLTVVQLQAIIGTLNPITPIIDVIADPVQAPIVAVAAIEPNVVQTVDTSCAASVIATQEPPLAVLAEPLPLPVAKHAEPLPVARIAPPIVKQGFWSILGQCAASVAIGIVAVASAPIVVGGLLACVLIAHVANEI